MTMRIWAMTAVFLLGGLPLALGQDATGLIQQLADKDVHKRIAAASKLAAMGEAVRPALERVLHPQGRAAPKTQAATEAQQQQIAALILQLSNHKYKLRQKATAALVKLGRIAAPQLRMAARSKELETSTRAKQVLEKLYPKVARDVVDVQRVEAARLLALVGTRQSIPALRHALNSGGTSLSCEAAAALRGVLGGGPSDDSKLWETKRAKLLVEWEGYLAKLPGAPTGEATTFKLNHRKGTSLQASGSNGFSLRIDMAGVLKQMGQPAPQGTPQVMEMTQKGTSSHRMTVNRVKPLTVTLAFAEHESVMTQSQVGPGLGSTPQKKSWKGKALVVVQRKDGELGVTMGDKPLRRSRTGPMMQLGLLLAMQLPAGDYKPGQSRLLNKSFFRWMSGMVFATAPQHKQLGAYGKLTYLGRDGKQDRFFLVSQLSSSQGGDSVIRLALHGELRFDRERGVLTRYSLSGPMRVYLPGPAQGKMLGLGHWWTRYKIGAPQQAVEKTNAKK